VNGPTPPRSSATLLLIATFVLGMIAGAAILHIARMSLGRPHFGPPGPPPPPPIEHLTHELSLRPDQVEQLRAVLDTGREKMHEAAEDTREHIRAILDPEQLERFDAMRRPPPPGPGFPPPPR
jgi:Spy/CpxP family protein refolding chaperone